MPTARGRFGSAFAFALGAALCVAGQAKAASPGRAFRSPLAGSRFSPGMSARVLWDRGRRSGYGSGGHEEEMELLLSTDGGRTFPIRITRDLSPSTTAVLWRVPSLPTTHARLALRVGDGEGPLGERIALVSEEFVIGDDEPTNAELLHSVEGEWRTDAALDAPPSLALSSGMTSDPPDGIRALPASAPAATLPRAAAIAISDRPLPGCLASRSPDSPDARQTSSPPRLSAPLRL